MSSKLFYPPPAKLAMGLLASNACVLGDAKRLLEKEFGPIDAEGDILPFDASSYYAGEMGSSILRQFVAFERLAECGELALLKTRTNRLENVFLTGNKRQANFDPGLVTLEKLAVASTKPASYRIYLSAGIYAQPMLVFECGSFKPLAWTYADYQWPATIRFFNRVREAYQQQLTATKRDEVVESHG